MALEMRDHCERCNAVAAKDAEMYICVYECTFCVECAESIRHICPNCGGELARRPRPRRIDTDAASSQSD